MKRTSVIGTRQSLPQIRGRQERSAEPIVKSSLKGSTGPLNRTMDFINGDLINSDDADSDDNDSYVDKTNIIPEEQPTSRREIS